MMLTAEDANSGTTEAAPNKEQGAGGRATVIVAGFWCFRLFKRGEESNPKVFHRCLKNGNFVRCAWGFGAKK